MAQHFNSIIIGGGHNGLVCAAYLAKAGRSVLVLEAADEVGGAAATRAFAPGFKVSSGAHLLHSMPADLIRELDLTRHGLSFAGQALSSHALSPDGNHLRVGDRQVHGLSRDAAADAAAFIRFTERMTRYAQVIQSILGAVPPRLAPSTWSQRLTLLRLGLRIRRLGRDDMRELLRIIGMNAYDLLNEYFDSNVLKGALACDAILGAEWGPRSPGSVLTLLYRMAGQNGAGALGLAQPAGGMGALTQAIAHAARAAGAVIRTRAKVRRVIVDNDRATGVTLESGETITAETVVSNADPRSTFLNLLGAEYLDTEFVRRVTNLRSRGQAAKLHLALDGLPQFTNLDPAALSGRLLVAPSMDYIEHAFNPAKYGEYPQDPVLEITLPTVNDPSLAPNGQHVLSAVVQYVPYAAKLDTDTGRAFLIERVLRTLERYAPKIRDQIRAVELLTPRDLEAEFGMTGGHWHHGALTLDQFFLTRPVPGAAHHQTPVAGLYLCGAGCHPGGGVMGIAGRNAARQVLSGAF